MMKAKPPSPPIQADQNLFLEVLRRYRDVVRQTKTCDDARLDLIHHLDCVELASIRLALELHAARADGE